LRPFRSSSTTLTSTLPARLVPPSSTSGSKLPLLRSAKSPTSAISSRWKHGKRARRLPSPTLSSSSLSSNPIRAWLSPASSEHHGVSQAEATHARPGRLQQGCRHLSAADDLGYLSLPADTPRKRPPPRAAVFVFVAVD